MKTKFIWFISCLMVVSLVLASCKAPVVEEKEGKGVVTEGEKKEEKVEEAVKKEGPQYGGMLNWSMSTDITSWDPFDGQSDTRYFTELTNAHLLVADWYVDRSVCDYTYHWDYRNRLELSVGYLAESWSWEDPVTLIFNLRKGVRWENKDPANGREFIADDVVWNMEKFLTTPKYAAHVLQNIESVKAPDKYTVVFNFKKAQSTMLEYVAYSSDVNAYQSPDVGEKYGDFRDWKTLVATGPFVLADYVQGSVAVYERNPDYFRKDLEGNQLPYVDGVRYMVIPDIATRISALRTGKLDAVDPVSPVPWGQKESLETSSPELQWAKSEAGTFWYIAMHTDKAPFNDVRVRRAVSMATDRKEIAESIFGGYAVPVAWPANPKWPGVWTPIEELPEEVQAGYIWSSDNIGNAKNLLAEAGYPNGFTAICQYAATGKYEVYDDVMELIASQWAKIGVELDLTPVDATTGKVLKRPPFPYTDTLGTAGGQEAPFTVIEGKFRTGAAWNRSLVSDPVIDEAYQKALETMDLDEQKEIFKAAYQHITGQFYHIGMPQVTHFTAWWPWLKGYNGEYSIQGKGIGVVLSYVWLDQDLREEMTGRR